jgi:hypothetical protein
MNDFPENEYKHDNQDINPKIIFIKLVILSITIFISIKCYQNDTLIKTFLKQNSSEKKGFIYNSFKKRIYNNPYIPQGKNKCEKYDPYNLFQIRFKSHPIYLCKSDDSEHLCYVNHNAFSIFKKGVSCQMKNFFLNTSNWKEEKEEDTYMDPMKIKNTFLLKGFFKMKCDEKEKFDDFNIKYNKYFESWDYDSDYKDDKINGEKIEELASNKTIFFISRNKDSPNLFFGGSAVINAFLLMEHFNLSSENIQVIFFENMNIKIDPFYDIYKNVISRGGEPIHISQLKNKTYHIKEAFYVPINWDSPCFSLFPDIQNCIYSGQGYNYFNELINKYLQIPNFTEPTNYDKEIYYYPKNMTNPNSSNYTTFLTVLWRRVWPKGRIGQERLMGNGEEWIEKLYEVLPKSTLIRLVDTSRLTIIEQISLMKKTDYLLGIHGAGLFLSVFLPQTSIVNEINTNYKSKNLEIVSKLSGHKTYIDNLIYKEDSIEGNYYVYFNPNVISERVYKRMNEMFYLKGFKHEFL